MAGNCSSGTLNGMNSRSSGIARYLLLAVLVILFIISTSNRVAKAQQVETGSRVPDLMGMWIPDHERSERWPRMPPYSSAGLAEYEAIDPENDPSLRCIFNVPNILAGIGPYVLEIIQRDDKVTFLYEQMHQVRRIYLDGRQPIARESTVGHSAGYYEDDTLVVETTNIRPLKNAGPPMQVIGSDRLRVIERYTRDGETLMAEITIDDPKFYEQPWTAQKVWTWSPDATIYEYECEDPRFHD